MAIKSTVVGEKPKNPEWLFPCLGKLDNEKQAELRKQVAVMNSIRAKFEKAVTPSEIVMTRLQMAMTKAQIEVIMSQPIDK